MDLYRTIEADDRARTIGFVGIAVVGASQAICGLWIGWWMSALFEMLTLTLITIDRRLDTNLRLNRAGARALVWMVLLTGLTVAITGGPRSPYVCLMAVPVGMVAARFRLQDVMAALGLTIMITLVATVGVHPQWAINEPVGLLVTLARIVAVISIVWAFQAAKLLHGCELIIDQLTELLHRDAVLPQFVDIVHQARFTGQAVSMILCGIDDFRAINDEYGRGRGDAVLREVASAMRKSLRPYELIYRLWGTEVMIVLPDMGLWAATAVAEHVREAVEQARPTGIVVTISLGVSAVSGALVDFEQLLNETGQSLFEATRAGCNRVVAAA